MKYYLHNRLGRYGAIFLATLAAALYCSWPLGMALNPAASRTGLASELGAYGQPYNWFFIGGDIVSGVLLIGVVLLLWRSLRPSRYASWSLIALLVYGICGAIDASLPMRCLPSLQVCGPVLRDPQLILHGVVDVLGSAALVASMGFAVLHVRRHNPAWMMWLWIVMIGGLLFGLASAVLLVLHMPGFWAQRYYITLSSIWVATTPAVLSMPKYATLTELNNVNIQRRREN